MDTILIIEWGRLSDPDSGKCRKRTKAMEDIFLRSDSVRLQSSGWKWLFAVQ